MTNNDDTRRQRATDESENERGIGDSESERRTGGPDGVLPVGRRDLLKWSATTGVLGTVASTSGAASLPSPWSNRDIGDVDAAGSASESGGTFTVKGAGEDIWNAADEFHYGYQTLSGDGAAIAKVTSQEYTNGWSKSGLMIREDLSADSKHAMMAVTGSSGTQFLWRETTGGTSDSSTPADGIEEPYYVKIEREGDTLTGYKSSPNGNSWVTVGTVDISMSTDVHVGLAVTSHSAGELCTATFEDVSVSESLWDDRDIGAVDASGGFSISNGTYTVDGGGKDIWGTADEFHYAYRPMDGSGTMDAEVTWFNHAEEWSKAGVMIREDLSPGAKNAMMTLTGGHGSQFQWRDTIDGTSDSYVPDDGVDEPHYVRVERDGDTFIGYKSNDGSNWTELERVTVDMSADVYAGLAVTSNKEGTLSAAEFENVELNGSGLAFAGGPGYYRPVHPSEADYTVSSDNWSTLKGYLESASAGETVYVTADVTIPRNSSEHPVNVNDGVTLAGDRGIDGSAGAAIHLDDLQDENGDGIGVFFLGQNNRVTGLRIRGPEPDPIAWNGTLTKAFLVQESGCEIDNCEIYNWDGIGVQEYGGDGYVHHCDLHNNQAEGYGYGVAVYNGGHPTVQYCAFDKNRHSIAAAPHDGTSGTVNGYTVEHCWFGPDSVYSVFDHHGAADTTLMAIRNCTIEAGSGNTAVKLRHQESSDATPERLDVENVWFYHDALNSPCGGSGDPLYVASSNCSGTWADLNVYLTNNHFDPDTEPSGGVGHPR